MVLLLCLVSLVTFVIFYLFPSADPAVLRAGHQPSPELIATIRKKFGLDQPFYVQYFNYMKALVLHFDFGYSYQNNIPVRTQLFQRLPATVSVTVGASIIWLLAGITIGTISATRPRSRL